MPVLTYRPPTSLAGREFEGNLPTAWWPHRNTATNRTGHVRLLEPAILIMTEFSLLREALALRRRKFFSVNSFSIKLRVGDGFPC